jgi:hypothetical protein
MLSKNKDELEDDDEDSGDALAAAELTQLVRSPS